MSEVSPRSVIEKKSWTKKVLGKFMASKTAETAEGTTPPPTPTETYDAKHKASYPDEDRICLRIITQNVLNSLVENTTPEPDVLSAYKVSIDTQRGNPESGNMSLYLGCRVMDCEAGAILTSIEGYYALNRRSVGDSEPMAGCRPAPNPQPSISEGTILGN